MQLKLSEIDTGFDELKLDTFQHSLRKLKSKREFKIEIVARDKHLSLKAP